MISLPKILYSKTLLGLLIIIVIFAVGVEYKQYANRKKIDAEILELINEEQRLVSSNQQLEQTIGFLSSPEYQEKLARLQLNLKKPDEIVINFPTEGTIQDNSNQAIKQKPNAIKWWEYIFLN